MFVSFSLGLPATVAPTVSRNLEGLDTMLPLPRLRLPASGEYIDRLVVECRLLPGLGLLRESKADFFANDGRERTVDAG
jgi:hypothetical protein